MKNLFIRKYILALALFGLLSCVQKLQPPKAGSETYGDNNFSLTSDLPPETKIVPDRYYRRTSNPEFSLDAALPMQPNQSSYGSQITYPYKPQPYYQQYELRQYRLMLQDRNKQNQQNQF